MLLVVLLGACGGDDDGDTNPAATIEAYVDAYNSGDLTGVMRQFADDAVMTGHPAEALASGITIRAIHSDELLTGPTYTISNVVASGNTVTWDHVWTRQDNGQAFCVEGHSAVIEDGKIKTWTWPNTDFQC